MTGYARLPQVDFERAKLVFEPSGSGEGNRVGAPSILRHEDSTYLAVRWHEPGRRGFAVALCELTARDRFVERTRITADELGVRSLGRPALVADPRSRALKLYLSVDASDGNWAVQALDEAATLEGFDPRTATTVLAPRSGESDAASVSDPYVLTLGGRYFAFYAGHDGTSEQAHLATSVDGERWQRIGSNPLLGRRGWHDCHTRISCVVPAPAAPVWNVFYDGSGRDDYGRDWNQRTGVAVAHDLSGLVDTTPNGPALAAPDADGDADLDGPGACRYVDVLADEDGRELFAEVARPDGSTELRRCYF